MAIRTARQALKYYMTKNPTWTAEQHRDNLRAKQWFPKISWRTKQPPLAQQLKLVEQWMRELRAGN